MYLTVVLDWYSRQVLAWRLSNTLDSSFCVEILEEALRRYGAPAIFNAGSRPVHERGVYGCATDSWGADQHGRQR